MSWNPITNRKEKKAAEEAERVAKIEAIRRVVHDPEEVKKAREEFYANFAKLHKEMELVPVTEFLSATSKEDEKTAEFKKEYEILHTDRAEADKITWKFELNKDPEHWYRAHHAMTSLILGTVFNQREKPVSDVAVHLEDVNKPGEPLDGFTKLSKDGKYRFEKVPHGAYRIVARKIVNGVAIEGLQKPSDPIVVDGEKEVYVVNIHFSELYIKGKAIDMAGQPIPKGVHIYAVDEKNKKILIGVHGKPIWTTVGDNGEFALTDIPLSTDLARHPFRVEGNDPKFGKGTQIAPLHDGKVLILHLTPNLTYREDIVVQFDGKPELDDKRKKEIDTLIQKVRLIDSVVTDWSNKIEAKDWKNEGTFSEMHAHLLTHLPPIYKAGHFTDKDLRPTEMEAELAKSGIDKTALHTLWLKSRVGRLHHMYGYVIKWAEDEDHKEIKATQGTRATIDKLKQDYWNKADWDPVETPANYKQESFSEGIDNTYLEQMYTELAGEDTTPLISLQITNPPELVRGKAMQKNELTDDVAIIIECNPLPEDLKLDDPVVVVMVLTENRGEEPLHDTTFFEIKAEMSNNVISIPIKASKAREEGFASLYEYIEKKQHIKPQGLRVIVQVQDSADTAEKKEAVITFVRGSVTPDGAEEETNREQQELFVIIKEALREKGVPEDILDEIKSMDDIDQSIAAIFMDRQRRRIHPRTR